jgi:hypothetical protein
MFRSYDHHQVEKYITILGLLNWQRIRCFTRSHITVIVYIMLRIVDMPLLWATDTQERTTPPETGTPQQSTAKTKYTPQERNKRSTATKKTAN